MSTVPTPRDRTGKHPLVGAAIVALLAFGDLTREQAAILLPMWRHAGDLSAEDFEAVIARFPVAAEDAGGWISGAMS